MEGEGKCVCVAERLVAKDSVEGEGGREEREGETHPSVFSLAQTPTPKLFLLKSVKMAYVHTVDVLLTEQNYMYMWQSRIEIEYYSVAYFKHITEFDAL